MIFLTFAQSVRLKCNRISALFVRVCVSVFARSVFVCAPHTTTHAIFLIKLIRNLRLIEADWIRQIYNRKNRIPPLRHDMLQAAVRSRPKKGTEKNLGLARDS